MVMERYVFPVLYLYEDNIKAYSYLISNRQLHSHTFGYAITQESEVSLATFIGQLVLDGYPPDRIRFTDEVMSKNAHQ